MADAVIFDCDGVLINSEVIYLRVALAYLGELGLTYDPHAYADRFLGASVADFTGGLNDDHHHKFGRPLPEDFDADLSRRIWTEMEDHVAATAGIRDVLDALDMPKAIASGSSPEGLERALRKVELFDSFAPHIYSAHIVARGKPAPDIYLHAAREINVSPARRVAVEDSANGAASAYAAGMTVIGFTGGGHCPPHQAERLRAAGAVEVIAHMDDLLAAIGRAA